jgi:hypothetical protein
MFKYWKEYKKRPLLLEQFMESLKLCKTLCNVCMMKFLDM